MFGEAFGLELRRRGIRIRGKALQKVVRCTGILAEINEAEMEVTSGKDTATGLLRVTSTFAFGTRWLAPLLKEFQAANPENA